MRMYVMLIDLRIKAAKWTSKIPSVGKIYASYPVPTISYTAVSKILGSIKKCPK